MAIELGENKYKKYGQPSLDLQFSGPKGSLKNRLDNGAIGVEFTRSSVGTYVGSDGLIKTAAIDEARFDYDPETGESLGLLLEEQRTNLITQSNSLSSFSYTSHTLTQNDTTSPDGTVNASKVTSGGGGTAYKFTTTSLASTFSMYCKADSVDWVKVSISGSADTWFDLQSGVVGNGSGTIQTLANGWVRISVSTTQTGSIQTQFFPTIANGSFDRSSGNSMFVWGAQLEEGSFPTSYIPTDGTPGGIIRAADVASMTGTNFSSWYNQSEGTTYSEYNNVPFGGGMWYYGPGSAPRWWSRNERGDGTRTQSFDGSGGSGVVDIVVSGSGVGNIIPTLKHVVAIDNVAQEHAGAANGSAVVTGLWDDITGVSALQFGRRSDLGGNNGYLNGHISRLTYWPRRLPDSDLQKLTQ